MHVSQRHPVLLEIVLALVIETQFKNCSILCLGAMPAAGSGWNLTLAGCPDRIVREPVSEYIAGLMTGGISLLTEKLAPGCERVRNPS